MPENKKYWFPAKRYGWGWGLPSTWQGWFVLLIFSAFAAAGVFLFPPAVETIKFSLYLLGISAVLIGVCYAKGEPPSWHWRKPDNGA